MITELRQPIPVKTPLGEGIVLYVRDNGPSSNDTWLVALDDGRFLHFLNTDCVSVGNATFGVAAPKPTKPDRPSNTTWSDVDKWADKLEDAVKR